MTTSSPEVDVEPARRAGSTLISGKRTIWAALGTALMTVGAVLPVWGTRLVAPQYPKGLSLWVYGGKATGDVKEVNGLNHYIGMKTLDVSTVPELRLWPWVVLLAVGLFLAALFLTGWWRRLALIGLWLVPIGVLADIERWLIFFGTNLDEKAALRLEPFIPLAVGPTKIWNFSVWSYPGPGLVAIMAAALVATLVRKAPMPPARHRATLVVGLLAAQLLLTTFWVTPSISAADSTDPAGQTSQAGGFDLAAALAEAAPNSTLTLPPGRYPGNFVITVPLTLLGRPGTILDGGGRGTVLTIDSSDVTVRGLLVTGSGGQVDEGAGIKILGSRVSVEDTTIEQSYTGISVQKASEIRLVGNRIVGTGQVVVGAAHAMGGHEEHADDTSAAQGDGISLWNAGSVLIRDNRVESVRDAIYLNFANDVLVDTNQLTASRYGLHTMSSENLTIFGNEANDNLAGAVLMFTKGVEIARNQLTDSRSEGAGVGVVLKDVSKVRVIENVIVRNRIGLQAEGTTQLGGEASFVRNRVASNRIGVTLMASSDLVFGSNTFEDNLTQVWALEPGVERKNTWSYHGTGNRWSDYPGYDLGGDGLGDIPHVAGGDLQALLAAAPSLEAYRLSPAYRLLEASQIWWSTRDPIVEDRHPLTSDLAPPAAPPRSADGPVAWYSLGWLLVMTPIWHRVRVGRDT
jgi:nitrous oxidase accessory protein